MRTRRLAASTALILSIGALTPGAAHAVGASTLYVNNASGSKCSDSGSGTQAAPFCTLQAGVNAAVAGDTVMVASGSYSPVTISKSGTAAAPITITSAVTQGAWQAKATVYSTAKTPAFTISNAAYVNVASFVISTGAGEAALVEGSSHVTVDSLLDDGETSSGSAPVFRITGTSSQVTISRNQLFSLAGNVAAVQVDSGSSNDVITTNYAFGSSGGILVNGATGTDVTSNTLTSVCGQGIVLSGASTGSSIENNVVTDVFNQASDPSCMSSTAALAGIEVDSGAVSGTTLDYNVDYTTATSATPYVWAGTDYASATDLATATGQGAHELNADPGELGPEPTAGSNVIDSANSSAPGELSTDINGNARVDDPLVTNTGAGTYTGYDRGAAEYEDPLMPTLNLDYEEGTAPAVITATESDGTPGWATPTQWSIDFGDGSAAKTTNSPTAVKHTYTTAGTYTITVTATDGYGATGSGSSTNFATVRIMSDYVFHPVALTRILDTRNGTGTNGVVAAVKPNSALVLSVDGAGPLPASGVAAVMLNLTVTNPTGHGNISAYADGGARPSSSNLNFGAGQTVANQVIAQVGADGKIDLYNQGTGTVDLIADASGYFGSGAGVGLDAFGEPSRILDTRKGTGTNGVKAQVPAKGTLTLSSADTGGQLLASSTAVLNVTVTNAKGGGYLSVYSDGTTRPGTSSLNFGAGQTVANAVDVQVGSDGSIDFYNNASAPVDVIADISGEFSAAGAGYVPINPVRLLDTRKGIGAPQAAVGAFGTVQVTVPGVDGIPKAGSGGSVAVAANVTVTGPTAGGDIEAYPDGLTSAPGVSTLNFTSGGTVANAITMGDWSTGLKLYNQSPGSSQLILDVDGYYQ
jgi:hypothetical protein